MIGTYAGKKWRTNEFSPLELLSDEAGRFARTTCAQCGAHQESRFGTPCPEPSVLKKRFHGWKFGKAVTCPTCMNINKRRRVPKPKREPVRIQFKPKPSTYIQALDAKRQKERIEAMQPNVTPIKPEIPTADAKAARRDAHAMLELYFDIAAGCFKEDYSDKRIATETGASEEWVIRRREEEFGPLGAPPEIQAMRLELIALGREVASLTEKMTATYKRHGWPL